MKTVALAYGRTGLDLRVPDDALVVRPVDLPSLDDEDAAIGDALARPWAGPSLREIVGARRNVAVVFPDLTRPMPNRTVLPALLARLDAAGSGADRVELICATGTHRRATPDEMAELIGGDLVRRFRVRDHVADDGDHVEVGAVDAVSVRLDRHYVEADARILTGFVEPHFFAGFSGGPKGACPGLADTATILEAHSPRRIADPRATFGVLDGNPVHEFVRAAVALAPPDLSLDVTLNQTRRLTGVWCGSLDDAHRTACAEVSRRATTLVREPADIVVTTNAGYPLDRNLYQCVKGLAAATRVLKPGGTILLAAACADGVPAGGAFARLLSACAAAPSPSRSNVAARMNAPDAPSEPDRWQVQVLGRVLEQAEVWVRSDGLRDEEASVAGMRAVADLSIALSDALDHHGAGASVYVLPEGPLTMAGVA